ncbi:cytochrome oxidase small assembly protein [Massilia sp. BSC265]|nr:cytochrome oxidase small assembly protein [Massilia sp. BSC265]
MAPDHHSEVTRPSNLRTALILGGIALFFFASVFVKFTWLS